MYNRVVIISGGYIDDTFALEWIRNYAPEYTIVADSGMEFCRRSGIIPDMIIGDFDSVKEDTLSFFKNQEGIVFQELNPIKDDTDTEFAINQAIALGAKELTIVGGTGTRLDHVLGNIALLGIGMSKQVQIQLVDSHNRIRMIDKPVKIAKKEQFGSYVSLLPYQGEVTQLSLKGFKYPLENYMLKPYNSLGISNEITEPEAEIAFERGVLLVIESRD